MLQTLTNAAGERVAGQEAAACADLGRKLGDADAVGCKCGCSARHVSRMADAGLMPRGVKIGALRRWDLAEIDAWIAGGCKPVRRR